MSIYTPHLMEILESRDETPDVKVSRILRRFHAHGLIAKIPHSRKWRTTRFGQRVMATSIRIRELDFPHLLTLAA